MLQISLLCDWLIDICADPLGPLEKWPSGRHTGGVCSWKASCGSDSTISLLHCELWLNIKYVQQRHLLTPCVSLRLPLCTLKREAWQETARGLSSSTVSLSIGPPLHLDGDKNWKLGNTQWNNPKDNIRRVDLLGMQPCLLFTMSLLIITSMRQHPSVTQTGD